MSAIPTTPSPPTPQPPPASWLHRTLYDNVRRTLDLLPARFTSELQVLGIAATDLYSFNGPLGTAIESQVVEQLNELRELWDPDKTYSAYTFIRQAQRFPDVILRSADPHATEPILMGIELKGWYLLAKEGEPSFRYLVSPNVCAPQDLLVIYPWALKSITTGSPQIYAPYVIEARYAAEYRNWWWQYGRSTRSDATIHLSTVTRFYPTKDDPISDRPQSDSGKNFGRIARTRLTDDYVRERLAEPLSGIPLWAWQRFFKVFAESKTEEQALRQLEGLIRDFGAGRGNITPIRATQIINHIAEIVELILEES